MPVIVLQHGKHVFGMRQADFQIEEDGENKEIASFEEVSASNAGLKAMSPPSGIYTNEIVPEGSVNLNIVALDLINTPYRYQDAVKKRLLDYLEGAFRADRPTMLVVLHPTGLHVVHDFTSDPKVLAELVRRLKNRKHEIDQEQTVDTGLPGTLLNEIDLAQEYSAIENEFLGEYKPEERYLKHIADTDLETTFSELEQLAHALASVPGSKTLIWAFGGIVIPYSMDSRSSRIQAKYDKTLKLMSAAGIVVTPVDTYLETDNPGFSGAMYQRPAPGTGSLPLIGRVQIVQNFMDIAQRTGGDYCLMRREGDCFEKMSDYSSHYYLLTYYTPPSDVSRWHKLRVKVNGNGFEVRARNGYFSDGAVHDDEASRKRDIAQALAAPVDYRELGISMRWMSPPGARSNEGSNENPQLSARMGKRKFQVGLGPGTIAVDAQEHNHMLFDVVAVATDRDGKVLRDVTQQVELHPGEAEMTRLRKQGIIYSNEIELPARAVKVRFLVRDALTQRIGTVTVGLE